jgi:hypothetical protein
MIGRSRTYSYATEKKNERTICLPARWRTVMAVAEGCFEFSNDLSRDVLLSRAIDTKQVVADPSVYGPIGASADSLSAHRQSSEAPPQG